MADSGKSNYFQIFCFSKFLSDIRDTEYTAGNCTSETTEDQIIPWYRPILKIIEAFDNWDYTILGAGE